VAIVLIASKIVFGLLLLKKLKNNLNFYYLKKRKEIIFTIIFTSLVTLWKALYNYISFFQENDLKRSFLHYRNVDGIEIPLEIAICIIDIFMPLAAIGHNIRTVNFRKYLGALIKGVGLESHYLNSSIFIK
jgi:hypothetical protein